MLNNLKIGTKLNLPIGMFAAGLVVYAAIAIYSLTRVGVGGPVYNDIILSEAPLHTPAPARSTRVRVTTAAERRILA